MRIREYRPDDLETLMDIGNRAWAMIRASARAALGPDLYARISPEAETAKGRQIQAHAEAHPDWIRVCVDDSGRIVGFVTFRLDRERGVGEILNNAVDPDSGVRGAGQRMYAAVLDVFRKHRMRVAKVDTGLDDAHAPARRAYERAGFDRRLEHVTYYLSLED